MNLRFLETFVWVAKLRSFSLAAEQLHTTQAAVSHRIATLERELGVRLLERNVRDVSLTPQGVDALGKAERLVQLATEFKYRFSNPKALRGTVRIGAIGTVAHTWLPSFIDLVNERLPDVALEIATYTSLEIGEHIRRNTLDVGLLMGSVSGVGVASIELCAFPCAWVASPRVDLPNGRLDVEDFAHLRILSHSRDSQLHASITQMLCDAGHDETRVLAAPLGTIIRLAVEGTGIGVVPVAAVTKEIQNGSLRTLNVRQPLPPIPIFGAYLSTEERPLPALVTEVAAEAAAAFCRS
ncbi:LysR family transcriptional regulator [Chelativorans sp.]|uniref:LysR family transcriptional regulator n=1 Tax=Chelativorans sp. TaxID=2203393 RepID=UPI0028116D41|nr:LysR family transcriptional regulator [Chelativorans sp.]